MFVKQLSIFVQNEPGRLAQIAGVIAKAGVDIRALSIADTTNFGILRLIVDKPDKAVGALRGLGLTVKVTEVIAMEVEDKPGEFANSVKVLSEGGVSVEYLYAFVSPYPGKARVILRVDDNEKAEKALEQHGITTLKEEDLYTK
ncbi:MAG: ACT domain-containing protein [Clostridiales bacterium]|jgi:hypothetical protein|nr:ACT domain-containing protein [Clostridiales bacterium]